MIELIGAAKLIGAARFSNRAVGLENGGSCRIRTCDQLVKSALPISGFITLNQQHTAIDCPIGNSPTPPTGRNWHGGTLSMGQSLRR